ncbi:MAG TPA: hypothetical protein VE326_10160 [Candidatus Binatia bacterium]|nr:hypothetical protein [Candidatus Binatia bacterium]
MFPNALDRCLRRIGAVCVLWIAAIPAGAAPASPADARAHGGVPDSILERPVGLRSGIGNSHEPVTTTSSEAQALYDQGLDYLESYVWVEAARSFHQALRLDPRLAMAHIGLSRSFTGLEDASAAKQELAAARTLQSEASPRERRRIAIRAKQLEAMDDPKNERKFRAYKKALDEALASDPDDIGLLLLRGNAEEPSPAGRGQLGTEASISYYRHVLRLIPDHASAHHFLTHTYEGLGIADSALAHGAEYARLAPSIPHAAHMWGHALRRAGRIAEAVAQFRRADAMERAYYRNEGIEPRYDWHHSHNLNLMAAVAQDEGRRTVPPRARPDAPDGVVSTLLARESLELPGDLIAAGRWAEALRLARAMTRDPSSATRVAGHVRAAWALRALRRDEEMRGEIEAARREALAIPAATGATVPRADALEQAVRDAAAGAPSRGDPARALTLFELEWAGRLAREAGAWEVASDAAEAMLRVDAAYEGSHRAEALVLEHEGYASAASRERDLASRLGRRAEPAPSPRA